MIREGSITLPDGRALAYAEYGDPDGRPVYFCQGTPSSRLMHPDEQVTRAANVRLFVADRPGFGKSDPKPGRTLLDWADDVACLADALGIGCFPVVGISGGGPYAAACAYRLRERVTAVGLVSAAGPPDVAGNLEGSAGERRAGFVLAQRAPWLLALVMQFFRNPGRHPEQFLDRFSPEFPQVDRDIQGRPDVRAMFLASYRESARQGVRAFAEEVALVSRPWPFSLGDIGVPAYVWHGHLDKSTPLAMGRYLASAIPGCEATFVPDAGHLLIFDYWREILSALLD